ncbi:MAG: DNA repair protein RadA [Acidimicrobiia bacterium]
MGRTRVRYRCSECGGEAARWLGRCPACGAWNSLGEDHRPVTRSAAVATGEEPVPIAAVSPIAGAGVATGVEELDRVLGGGLVAGSVTLIGGEPGIGKSTLVLQALGSMAGAGASVLLVAAEESVQQVRLRAERLGVLHDRLLVVAETSLSAVLAHVDNAQPTVVAVDSIQTVLDPDLSGAAGSVVQVRECAQRLVRLAKERNVITLLVGHVTKEGTLAGPRVLEHIVDTVLSFEGDRHHALRLLQVMKHRFGSTQELGLFEMTERGLLGVPDPSALFLTDRRPGASGSVVAPVLEGARPMLVELQALVATSYASMPRRSAQGLDASRFSLLLAVLERRAQQRLSGSDVYASVAGGVRVSEAGADLAIALAVASAQADLPVPPTTVVLGEIGLGGEVRQVPHTTRRLTEAARLGFTRAIVPHSSPEVPGVHTVRVRDVREALAAVGLLTIGGDPGAVRVDDEPGRERYPRPVVVAAGPAV